MLSMSAWRARLVSCRTLTSTLQLHPSRLSSLHFISILLKSHSQLIKMAFRANMKLISPIIKSMLGTGQRNTLQASRAAYSCIANQNKFTSIMSAQQCPKQTQYRQLGSDPKAFSSAASEDKPLPLAQALENEIQEEIAELNQRLSSDQFPGFSVETNDSDVKLTKQVGDTTVTVRFTVSSSLSEWRSSQGEAQAEDAEANQHMFQLMSLPDFQVQISRDGRTFEVSCYFEELDLDDESGEPYQSEPMFQVDEVVIYEGEPKETEFAVSTEYFRDELMDSLVQYLAEHGIDDEFSRNLVTFSTNYEKKQYIGLMKRLKDFVSR